MEIEPTLSAEGNQTPPSIANEEHSETITNLKEEVEEEGKVDRASAEVQVEERLILEEKIERSLQCNCFEIKTMESGAFAFVLDRGRFIVITKLI